MLAGPRQGSNNELIFFSFTDVDVEDGVRSCEVIALIERDFAAAADQDCLSAPAPNRLHPLARAEA
jgi:hypothetical protein